MRILSPTKAGCDGRVRRKVKMSRLGSISDRLLNGTDRRTYLLLALWGAAPIGVAFVTGTAWDVSTAGTPYAALCEAPAFRGYMMRPNWLAFIALLPAALFGLRFYSARLIGRNPPELPLVARFPSGPARERVRGELDRIASDGKLFLLVLAGALLLSVIDVLDVLSFFFVDHAAPTSCPAELDWSYLHLLGVASVSRLANAVMVLVAYSAQFAIFSMGLLITGITFRHNLLFLRLIYRRARASKERSVESSLVLRFDDPERRFGLSSLNRTFNLEITLLAVCGLFCLVSRYFNVGETTSPPTDAFLSIVGGVLDFEFDPLFEQLREMNRSRRLFSDPGQIMIAVAWLFLFGVIAMPSFVKFLPLTDRKARDSRTTYLLDFVPPQPGPEEAVDVALIDELALHFGKNSFWPQGDERAKLYYYFAFFTLWFILFPVTADFADPGSFLLYCLLLVGFSYGLTQACFLAYRIVLRHVDIGGG
jgi:hypothetical protein